MFSKRFCLASLLVFCLGTPLQAEKASMSPERLRKTATHVIQGKVTAIYTRNEKAGDWEYTRYVAEIQVKACEKGDGIAPDTLLYCRYWRRKWIGKGPFPLSTTGYRGLPKPGESLRVYLARNAYDGFGRDNNDGGFNVIGANGFERLKQRSNTSVSKDARK